ncbi:thiol reductant ABC exporter subunit CydD [Cryobacterium psychrophilum]|uniref:Thiol reductant ABC exporter subunit CydD n=1 Tax=Cryobacterium psychrophilum TaxID=41988 RepID=A0A4Y8KQD8_9MICO|nr:thiol reductant ABC exporter subunit CydD [Cryobacterium psychrophilum]TDW31520.1 ATP-binding cassette subfamily C protein CydD [Cryobacterium psychrophilum]TFD79327.1 thiol reductant ABC exporter subunit CydD [Cryobacterium psychrophilum]
MRPLDPRLLRYATAARWFLVVGAMLGLAQTLVVVAFAWLLTRTITLAIAGSRLDELVSTIAALAAVVVARAGLIWLLDLAASRGAAHVKSQLRAAVLDRLAEHGPDWVGDRAGAGLATTVTTGLDALDNYFSRYLPQLLLTVIATPVLVLVMLLNDFASGLTVVIVLPLIPVFMVLIGKATQGVQKQQWTALQRLSIGFLDVVGGLGTLKIFGREGRQFTRIRTITEDYRTRTMKVLRVSFLSGFVLELAASLSVALIAVSVGLRLVDGSLALSVGLFVLLLAPEAFLPVQRVGAQFHAAAEGLAAAEDIFAILDDHPRRAMLPDEADADGAARPPADALRLNAVTVRRDSTVVIDRMHAEFSAGDITVVRGPSGAGKSTLVAALLGFVPLDGSMTLGGRAIAPAADRSWLAWCGQRPGLLRGTVHDNVTLGDARVHAGLVAQSLAWAGAAEIDPDTVLGANGDGLSGGQAHRVAAARAIYRAQAGNCRVVVFDEPSSALDADTEHDLVQGLRSLADQGRIVIVVSHRRAVIAAADRVVLLGGGAHVQSR